MKVILAGRLIDGTEQPSQLNVALLVEEDKIVEIVPQDQLKELPEDCERIDLKEYTVLPGLIDGHLHLSFSCTFNPLVELFQEEDEVIALRILKNAEEALKAGITTVRDCAAKGNSIMKVRDAIKKGWFEASEIICCGMPITTTGGHLHFMGQECDTQDEVRKAIRLAHKQEADFIKVMVSGGNMTHGSNSRMNQYDLEMLKLIVDESHQLGKKVSAHVHTVEGIRNCVEAGVDTLEHCSYLTESGMEYDADLAEKIREKGLFVCPAMGKAYTLPPEQGAPLPEKIAMWAEFTGGRFETTRRMYQQGVKIFAGTDGGCKLTKPGDYYETLKTLHEKVGMTKEDVIRSATTVAAGALGIEDRVGSLRRGMQADIIAVEGNPQETLESLGKIAFVMKKGSVVKSRV